jgi:hypothetical protein
VYAEAAKKWDEMPLGHSKDVISLINALNGNGVAWFAKIDSGLCAGPRQLWLDLLKSLNLNYFGPDAGEIVPFVLNSLPWPM